MHGGGVLTAESPGRERCGRVRIPDVAPSLENRLDVVVDLERGLTGGREGAVLRASEGASREESLEVDIRVDDLVHGPGLQEGNVELSRREWKVQRRRTREMSSFVRSSGLATPSTMTRPTRYQGDIRNL